MATGDVVNTCSRLQSAAPVDGILVDEPTYRATSAVIEYRDAEPVHAKGKSEPVPVWEVVAPRTRLGVDIAFKGGARAGRPDRRARSSSATLSRARSESASPQLVTLVGSPGIGKSRLLFELWSALDKDSTAIRYWRQGRSLPYGEGVSFWALGEMVKAQAGILESDASDGRRREAAHRRGRGRRRRGRGRLGPASTCGPSSGSAGRPRTRATTAARPSEPGAASSSALAEQHPLVLVFEDLHWADDGLLDFVDHLVDWSSGVPILVVVHVPAGAARAPSGLGRRQAERRRPCRSRRSRTRRPSSCWPPSSRGRPSRTAARRGSSPTRAATRSTRRSTSACSPSRSRGPEIPLPETVQGIIAARLDTLAAEEKALLQGAAVVGKVFWVGSLTAVSGRPRDEVEEGLLRLERKEFVRRERRSSVAGETAFVFRHVLVRDVAYAQIPRGRPRRDAPARRRVARGPGRRPRRGPGRPDRPPLPERAPVRAGGRPRPRRPARAGAPGAPGGRRPRPRALRLRGRRPLLRGGAGLLAGGRRRAAPPAPPLRAGALPRRGVGGRRARRGGRRAPRRRRRSSRLPRPR